MPKNGKLGLAIIINDPKGRFESKAKRIAKRSGILTLQVTNQIQDIQNTKETFLSFLEQCTLSKTDLESARIASGLDLGIYKTSGEIIETFCTREKIARILTIIDDPNELHILKIPKKIINLTKEIS